MAEGKKDPARITLPKTASEAWSGKGLKGDTAGVLDEEKVIVGFLDEPKDQLASENSIPLSPQWLYSKHSESKVGNSAASGDARPPNFLPHGTSTDCVQKDSWRLDGPPDRKEWRRNVPDVENSRRWRDEERETSLIGRRERRKEGDRESEFRKNDRRSENISTRDSGESRNLPSSDRWHEVTSRNTGNENRRDSKWSSRWGPEDKDSRAERKMDADKDDQFAEKQSFLGSSRLLESDTRDKWRPRHRQELHSGAPTVYRAAPGFALDRGREEVSHVGFALGRGRGGLTQARPFSAGPVGAAPLSDIEHVKSGLFAHMFRYPRGKLLDIYRKQQILPDFETAPPDLADVPLLPQTKSISPLALISPDTDEEALLEDISKGKVTGSEVSYMTSRDPDLKCDSSEIDHILGIHGDTLNNLLSDRNFDSIIPEVSDRAMMEFYPKEPKNQFTEENVVKDAECLQYHCKNSVIERALSDVPYDISSKLANDSSSLFEISFTEEIPRDKGYSYDRSEAKKHLEMTSHEELSLFYRDPQGDIQGPFLGVDVISWFEQGFFGLDLPVCLLDAPEGTPFQPLGELMPLLKGRSNSTAESTDLSVPFDIANDKFEPNGSLASSFGGSLDSSDRRLTTAVSESMDAHEFQPQLLEFRGYIEHPSGRARLSELEISSGIPVSKSQSLHDFAGQDADEVIYSVTHMDDFEKPLEKPANDDHDLSHISVRHQFVESEIGQALMTNYKNPSCDDMNPLGLLWSELEGSHDRRPISSNIAGIHDQVCNFNPSRGVNSLIYGHEKEQFSSVNNYPFAHDAWPGASIRRSRSNETQDILDPGPFLHVEANSNHIGLEDQLLPQQFQQQQLQNHLPSPHQNMNVGASFAGSVQGSVHHRAGNQSMIDFEYLIKLQLQEQHHLHQIQQQQQLQQQQQELHHQIQILQQQQQQEQQQQRLFEHLLRQRLHDPSFAASHIDQLLGSSSLDQSLMRQRLIQDLERQPHHLQRHQDPMLEQLMQAKLSCNLHHEQHDDLLDVLSHRKHRSSLSMEEQILLSLQQEQLQARQFSLASRQQQGMEEDKHVGGIWSFDESGQFVRTASSPLQPHLNRLNQLDFVQSLQQPSSIEQASQLEQNLMLHERVQHHPYDTSMQHFDNSIHLSHSPPEPNPDVLNALARLQGFDVPEIHGHMYPSVQPRQFHPVNSSHEHSISNQSLAHHLDVMDSHWPESNGLKAQLNQLNFEAGRQSRDTRGSLFNRDSNLRAALVRNENSNYGIDELFQQKLVLQPSQHSGLVDTTALSYEDRNSSWFTHSSLDSSFKLAKSAALHDSFSEGSSFSKQLNIWQDGMMDSKRERQASDYDTSGRLSLLSRSSLSIEPNQLFSDEIKKQAEDLVGNDSFGDRVVLSDSRDGKKLKQLGSKGKALSNTDQAVGSLLIHKEVKANAPLRHASMGSNAGGVNFDNYEIGADNVYSEGMINSRSLGILDRGSDNSSSKHTQDACHTPILVTQGSLGELVSAPTIKGKNPSGFLSGEGRGETGGNHLPLVPGASSASGILKDMRLRRTSSRDADAPEASFADLIKSTYKPAPESELHPSSHDLLESGHGAKSGKKKGKKGRQIDPSLLGFKVHSNRIMMGEIQRPDD